MTLKYKKTKRCSYTPKLVVYVHLFQRIKEIYEQLFIYNRYGQVKRMNIAYRNENHDCLTLTVLVNVPCLTKN